jgi:hypothetical protein
MMSLEVRSVARKLTFGQAAATVISRVKQIKRAPTITNNVEEFRQLAVMANTLYGVTAAVLKRTSKVMYLFQLETDRKCFFHCRPKTKVRR